MVTRTFAKAQFLTENIETSGRGLLDVLTALKPHLKISLCTNCLEILVDIAVKLISFRVVVDLLLLQGDQSNRHVEQVVLVLFIHKEIEDFVHQGYLHVSILGVGTSRTLSKSIE